MAGSTGVGICIGSLGVYAHEDDDEVRIIRE